jgi:hypothetical protein
MMRRIRIKIRRGPSEALKELGKAMAERQGVKPLGPDETRPEGYYTVNHFTSRSGVPLGAVIRKPT